MSPLLPPQTPSIQFQMKFQVDNLCRCFIQQPFLSIKIPYGSTSNAVNFACNLNLWWRPCLRCESIVRKSNYTLEQCLVDSIITDRTIVCPTKLAKFLVGGMHHSTTTLRISWPNERPFRRSSYNKLIIKCL
jgi:hypothetical protein